MLCDLRMVQKYNNRIEYKCRNCGRVTAAPETVTPEELAARLPPCGHDPFSCGGHLFVPDQMVSATRYRCQHCGVIVESSRAVAQAAIRRAAEKLPPCEGHTSRTPPPITTQAKNYAKAVARWAADGFQARSEEEIARLYAICLECPEFDRQNQRCLVCGCRVATDRNPMRNKLAMPTEKCPRGKW